jgi:hypothetical protein
MDPYPYFRLSGILGPSVLALLALGESLSMSSRRKATIKSAEEEALLVNVLRAPSLLSVSISYSRRNEKNSPRTMVVTVTNSTYTGEVVALMIRSSAACKAVLTSEKNSLGSCRF